MLFSVVRNFNVPHKVFQLRASTHPFGTAPELTCVLNKTVGTIVVLVRPYRACMMFTTSPMGRHAHGSASKRAMLRRALTRSCDAAGASKFLSTPRLDMILEQSRTKFGGYRAFNMVKMALEPHPLTKWENVRQ
jgi:hypothetical protein